MTDTGGQKVVWCPWTSLLLTSLNLRVLLHGLWTKGLRWKAFSSRPQGARQGFMRWEVNLNSLAWEILSKRQRKILAFAFLGLENCTWQLTPSALYFPGKSRVEITLLSDVAACGEGWRHSTDGMWWGARAELYAISALVSFACIIHVTPTNYLGLAPSKRRNVVDLSEGIFSLLHHAAQSRLHIGEVSSPFSDTVKLRLLIFS